MTRATTQSSIYRVWEEIVKKEGGKALFRGIKASCYQSAISSTGFALVYELIKRFSSL